MKLITIALAILLVAALCFAQQIPGAFDTPLPVKAGEGSTSYEFTLPSDEWFRVDFVNPDTDFTFIVGNGGSTNPIPSLASPRDTPLKFLTLTLSNDTIVNAGVVLRWRYSSVAVEPTTMEFVIVRGNTRWWEFDHYSELDAPTQIIAQSLPSTELNAGTNMIGIFGGNPVTLPDEGDPRYQVFGTSYTAEAAVSNKYEYKLDRKQIFHLEFINPSNEFSFTVNRTASNPGSDLTTGLKGIYFFDISINSAQQPGPDGLRYGSVLTFQYPVGIPENIVEETLNFLIYDGSSWKSFSQESERSSYTKYVTQPTNVYLEFSSLHLQVALVAQQKSVDPEPEESPETSVAPVQSSQKPTPSTPTGSASGKPSEDPRTSGPQDSDVLGSSASSVQVKIVTFLLAALAIAALMM